MRHLFVVLFFFVSTPFVAVQQTPITVELGPPVFSTLPQSNGYRWVIRGHVFAAGTWTPPPGQPLPRGACEQADFNQRIGTYAIFGSVGNAGEHVAQYRATVRGESYTWAGLFSYYEDEGGAPGSMLYSAAKVVGGEVVASDPPVQAEYTPRAKDCFGGQVKIYAE